jgi:hypothetical protein
MRHEHLAQPARVRRDAVPGFEVAVTDRIGYSSRSMRDVATGLLRGSRRPANELLVQRPARALPANGRIFGCVVMLRLQ